MTGIYEILNLKTGQRYIGSSVDLKSRLHEHQSALVHGRHRNKRLQRAWNQGTPEDFSFRTVAILEKSAQFFIERRWLDYLNATGERGYNIQSWTGGTTYTHGLCSTPEHGVWNTMKNRCLNPHVKSYIDYGGRGITVCERWRTFIDWYHDMGPRPSKAYSLERLNNDGHYSCGTCTDCKLHRWPMNVVWATKAQQSRNRRNNRWITVHGETKHLAEWARDLGCHVEAIRSRLAHGWSEEDAVTIPADMPATKTAQCALPEWRAAQSARVSAYVAEHPEVAQEFGQRTAQAWADPVQRAHMNEAREAARAADPTWKERMAESLRGRTLTEAHKQNIGIGSKRAFEDPAMRLKHRRGIAASGPRWNQKLQQADAEVIRQSPLSASVLAAQYGVSKKTIQNVRHGVTFHPIAAD